MSRKLRALLALLRAHHVKAWVDRGELYAESVATLEEGGLVHTVSDHVKLPANRAAVLEFLGY